MKLTVRQIDTAKPKEKPYKLSDGGGLYLEVTTNGSRYWRLKYRYAGKEKRLAFGVLDLTLYIQTPFLSYGCDNFLRLYSRGERYPSALCG
jgi:hypothetical protein